MPCGFWSLSLGLSVTQCDLARSAWYPAGHREGTPVRAPGHLASLWSISAHRSAASVSGGPSPERRSPWEGWLPHHHTLPEGRTPSAQAGPLSLPLTSPGPAFPSVLTAPAVFTANQPVFLFLSDLKPGLTPQLTGAAALLPALGHQPLRAPVTEGMTDLAGTQGPRL